MSPRETPVYPRDWLVRTTAMVRDRYPGIHTCGTACANWLVGLLMGHPDGAQHLAALDALLTKRTKDGEWRPRLSEARATLEARAYLALHEIADFDPPPQRRRTARMKKP